MEKYKKQIVIEKLMKYLLKFLGTSQNNNSKTNGNPIINVTIENHYHGTIDQLTINK